MLQKCWKWPKEKKKFYKSISSLPNLIEKISEAVNEQKSASVEKYTQKLRQILKNNGMKELIKPIKRLREGISQEEIDWNKVRLNFMELEEI